MGILFRLILSVITIVIFGWINFFLNAAGTLVSGKAAVHQLDNSDLSYLISTPLTQFAGHLGLSSIVLLIVLAMIWFVPIRRLLKAAPGPGIAGAVLLGFMLGAPHPAQAYYDKYDYTEAIYVLPNQSAFVIPDVGANKDSQGQFMSKEYLDANKVASKRVLVPHAKLSNSGSWSDYYVPTARIILVTRTPFNREWVTDISRGSSKKNEGFPCQSAEGLNITAGISIGVSVAEEGAAKYLYHFGTVEPKGDPTNPAVIFTSIYYARSVEAVMDTVGRGEVQALVCAELNAHTLDEDNKLAGKIMENVRAKAATYLTDRGITLDYIGWADTFSFDSSVQKALNDKYLSNTVQPVLSTLQALADVRVKEGLGVGLAEHGLPANLVVLPADMSNLINLFAPKSK